MSDGRIVIDITGDVSGYEKAVSELSSRTQKRLSSISGALDKAGSALTKGITVPAIGAASAVGSIFVAKGWGRLEAIDTAKSKLKGLGYSGDEVKGIMDSALDSVKGTAYGLGSAATVAVGALASGVSQGEDLTRVLKTIGDVATIAGGDFEAVAAVFNKVMSKGKLQGDEILQLSERGVPVLQILAKHLGITAEEVSELASKGQIGFATFEEAMRTAFGGAALASGESMRGTIENTWAAVSRVGAAFLDAGGSGEGFFTRLKPILGELTQDIDGMQDAAAEWGSAFADAFTGAVKAARGLVDAFNSLSPAQKQQAVQLAGIAVAAGPVLKLTSKLTSGAAALAGGWTKLKGVQASLERSWIGLTSATSKHETAQARSAKASVSAAAATAKQTGAVNASSKAMSAGAKAASAMGSSLKTVAPLVLISGLIMLGSVIADNIKRQRDFTTATDGLRASVRGASDELQSGGAVGVSYRGSLEATRSSVSNLITKQAELAQSIRESNAQMSADASQLDTYQQTISELTAKYDENGNKAQLTASEQARLKLAIEGVNGICGSSYQVVDALNGVIADESGIIDGTAEAIGRYIAQKKIQLQLDAMEGQYKDLLTAKADAQKSLTDALVEQKRIQDLLNENYAKGSDWVNENRDAVALLERDLDACNGTVDDARAAYDAAAGAADDMASSMEFMQTAIDGNASAWETFLAQESGIRGMFTGMGADARDLAADLGATGVSQEQFAQLGTEQLSALAVAYNGNISSIIGELADMGLTVNETMLGIATDHDMMSQEVQEAFATANVSQDDFMVKLSESGVSVTDFQDLTASQLAQLVQKYDGTIDSVKGDLDRFVAENKSKGQQGGAGLNSETASGMSSTRGQVNAQVDLTKSKINELDSSNFDSHTWGAHITGNLANGISANCGKLTAAVQSAAAIIKNNLGHSVPKEGPLRNGGKGETEWGEHVIGNLVDGMQRKQPLLERIAMASGTLLRDTFLRYASLGAFSFDIPWHVGLPSGGIDALSAFSFDAALTRNSGRSEIDLSPVEAAMEKVGSKIDAAADRIERVLERPVSLDADRREIGRFVRKAYDTW